MSSFSRRAFCGSLLAGIGNLAFGKAMRIARRIAPQEPGPETSSGLLTEALGEFRRISNRLEIVEAGRFLAPALAPCHPWEAEQVMQEVLANGEEDAPELSTVFNTLCGFPTSCWRRSARLAEELIESPRLVLSCKTSVLAMAYHADDITLNGALACVPVLEQPALLSATLESHPVSGGQLHEILGALEALEPELSAEDFVNACAWAFQVCPNSARPGLLRTMSRARESTDGRGFIPRISSAISEVEPGLAWKVIRLQGLYRHVLHYCLLDAAGCAARIGWHPEAREATRWLRELVDDEVKPASRADMQLDLGCLVSVQDPEAGLDLACNAVHTARPIPPLECWPWSDREPLFKLVRVFVTSGRRHLPPEYRRLIEERMRAIDCCCLRDFVASLVTLNRQDAAHLLSRAEEFIHDMSHSTERSLRLVEASLTGRRTGLRRGPGDFTSRFAGLVRLSHDCPPYSDGRDHLSEALNRIAETSSTLTFQAYQALEADWQRDLWFESLCFRRGRSWAPSRSIKELVRLARTRPRGFHQARSLSIVASLAQTQSQV